MGLCLSQACARLFHVEARDGARLVNHNAQKRLREMRVWVCEEVVVFEKDARVCMCVKLLVGFDAPASVRRSRRPRCLGVFSNNAGGSGWC